LHNWEIITVFIAALKEIMIHTTDVTLIGGLFAIFECGMMKLKAHVIDALPEVGAMYSFVS
jgi:hypothetical protein